MWKDSKGITLIEIVVTIAILGIMSLPLMNCFVAGMNTNNAARRTEELNQISWDVAEAFDTVDLNKLFSKMNTGGIVEIGGFTNILAQPAGTDSDADGNSNKYELTFQDQAGSFQNNKYFVTATLEKSKDDELPKMADIGNANTMKICSEYYKNDDLYSPSACRKESVLNVVCTKQAADEYTYAITLDVAYGADVISVYHKNITVKKSEKEKYLNLFLLCNYFDKTGLVSSDKLKINYKYNANGSGQEDLPVQIYLYTQEIQSDGHQVSMNPGNVEVDVEGNCKVYTNLAGVSHTETGTTGTKKMFTVYSLHVDVRKDSTSGEVVATLDTAIAR